MPSHVRDAYDWLTDINKASAIVLRERGIITPDVAALIADAVLRLDAMMATHPEQRSGDYKIIEKSLLQLGGAAVSLLHSGRSRVDLGTTARRLSQRQHLLGAYAAILRARTAMLDFAEPRANCLVPAYTQGRQAAAISFGHYMLATTAALEQECATLCQVYEVVNQSPLGANAVATSSFDIDRPRLAELLGFSGAIENSLFANEISGLLAGARIVGAVSAAALAIGMLAADLGLQYTQTVPWLTLREEEGGLTSRSTSMPHKLNPALLQDLRMRASSVLGVCVSHLIKSHNIPHGLPDFKGTEPELALQGLAEMMDVLCRLVAGLEFNAARAEAEVNGEYSATPELADILQRDHGIPFRIGHHFASEIVNFARAHEIPPASFPFDEARRIFATVAAENNLSNPDLPLTPEGFAQALSPRHMVEAARGLGGPQPAEVARMLHAQRRQLATDHAWLAAERARQESVAAARAAAFEGLRGGA